MSTEDNFQEETIQVNVKEFCTMIRLDRFTNAEFSSLFIYQLIHGFYNEPIHIGMVTDEISSLEGLQKPTHTKDESRFNREPLKGLYKKHFFNPRYIPKNLSNHFGIGTNKTNSRFYKLIKDIAGDKGYLTKNDAQILAQKFVWDGYLDRKKAGKLTGEWMIYAKYGGKNHYLTLALHDEGDQIIYDRILKNCRDDFPYLFAEVVFIDEIVN